MVLYNNASLPHLSAHKIGNKTNGEDLQASKGELTIDDADREKLLGYFLKSFTSEEYYHLSSTDGDFKLNPLYQFTAELFESTKQFHHRSVSIAKHLYEVSLHPQIKAGDFFIAYFSNLIVDGQETDALGFFKSESKSSILKLSTPQNGNFELALEDGTSLDKLDKACLIYNLDAEEGFRVSIIDRSSKSTDAQYWRELFLRVRPANTNFQSTLNVLDIARHFVADQITEEFELSRAEQLGYLTKSIDYFKKHEEFNQREFEQEVFEDPELIKSFRKFDHNFRDQLDLEREDSFTISAEVVKKQARVFKSVLKLDKNFHIYIHGDRELIERGVEKDGRKYYKIYYNNEL